MQSAIDRYPWHDKEDRIPKQIYLTYLHETPTAEGLERFDSNAYPPEEAIVDGKVTYYFPPNGAGRAKMSNKYMETKLKVGATTRNWRTTNKLLEMANQ